MTARQFKAAHPITCDKYGRHHFRQAHSEGGTSVGYGTRRAAILARARKARFVEDGYGCGCGFFHEGLCEE